MADLLQTDPSMAPSSDPTTAAAPTAPAGFVIEISCFADGTFSVESEPLTEEASEEAGGDTAEDAGDSANPQTGDLKSFGEALKKALTLQQSGGTDTSDDDFNSGYNSETSKMSGA